MTLNSSALSDLQAAVGVDNVSVDPGTCMSYAWFPGIGGIPKAERLGDFPPMAVVLPGSTEEVQQVVRACNRHGITFKPHTTGYGAAGFSSTPNCISIDLRRMNRIHLIDKKNQMAILDPYVTAGQLQAEAMKHGMNCHIIGAGPNHSPLASATSMFGVGITGATTSNNVRNLLGVEWVSPTGEIVRMGSCATGDHWFTDEGPGPGYRGMLRGVRGALGELGIFTRIGYKLYPWLGDEKLKRTGQHPLIGVELPQHFRLYHIIWDSWEDVTAAGYDINRSGIAETMLRMPPATWALAMTRSNNEYHNLTTSGNIPEIAQDANRKTWTVLCASSSAQEADYKEKVLRNIMQKTNGREMTLTTQQEQIVANTLLTSVYVPRCLRPTGALVTSFGVMDSFSQLPGTMAAGTKCLGDDVLPSGKLMRGSGEEFYTWPSERRHLWAENAVFFDINKPESRGAVIRYTLEHANTVDGTGKHGIDAFASVGPLADFFGAGSTGVNKWMRQIKKQLDPKRAQESQSYILPMAPPAVKHWKFTRPILFSPLFRPIFRRMMVHYAKVGLQGFLGIKKKK